MVRKLGFFVALIFNIHVDFLNLLFLDKFITISLILSPLSLTTLLLLILNAFDADSDDLFMFNTKISSIAILLKPQMKR